MDFLDLRSGAEIGELEKEEDTMEKSDLDFVQVSSQNTQDKLRNSSKGSTKKVLESWDSHDAEADREDNDSLESVSVDAEEGELVDGGKVGLPRVLKAFVALRADFDEKFKNMWA